MILKQILTELKAIRGTLGAVYGTIRENDTGEGEQTEVDRMAELYALTTADQNTMIRSIAQEKGITVVMSTLNDEQKRVRWIMDQS